MGNKTYTPAKKMGFCNFMTFLCCHRRYHIINNVLRKLDTDEVNVLVEEIDALYRGRSRLVEEDLKIREPVQLVSV